MATSRSVRRTGFGSVCERLFLAFFLSTYLMTSCNCLPSAKEKKPVHSDQSLLFGAVSEMEDALARLKQYAKNLKAEAASTAEQDDDDPLAESIERDSRDEDYRQEPEIVPGLGLDRFEKNVDETKETSAGTKEKLIQKGGADDSKDVSMQDFMNFLRENIKERSKEEGKQSEGKVSPKDQSVNPPSGPSSSSLKDVSLKEFLEFLKEHQKQKKDSISGSTAQEKKTENAEAQVKTVSADDTSNMSLKDALEYLASLKEKKFNEEKAHE